MADEAGIPAPAIESGAREGYRHRARLMVRGRAASPKIGLFQQGTHRIVDTPHCRVHHPLLNEAAAAVRRAIRSTGVPPYADRPHVGLIRALQGVVERPSQRLQLVLVANDDLPEASLAVADAVRRDLGDALHSLWWNGNPERTNVILGPHWQRVCGPATAREEIAGVGIHYPPGAFGQNHLELADRLTARVDAWIPDRSRVLEFHAGCGALGLGWLARVESLEMNELAEASLEGLAAGLAERPSSEQTRARVLPGRAGDYAARVSQAEVVVVDPPRRGLDPELLTRLTQDPPARLVYVSCGLEAFEREARVLLAGQRLELAELCAFDLFPFTEHIETLARFERRKA